MSQNSTSPGLENRFSSFLRLQLLLFFPPRLRKQSLDLTAEAFSGAGPQELLGAAWSCGVSIPYVAPSQELCISTPSQPPWLLNPADPASWERVPCRNISPAPSSIPNTEAEYPHFHLCLVDLFPGAAWSSLCWFFSHLL